MMEKNKISIRFYNDTLDAEGMVALAKTIRNVKAAKFLDWLTFSDNTVSTTSLTT